MKHYLDAAEKAARAAGKLLRKNFRRPQRVNAVAAHDIKLEIDVQAQELISRLLLKEFPKHALYGEEGIVGDQSSEQQWIVDPLDGTVNYFYGIPHFCVSIALRVRSEVMKYGNGGWGGIRTPGAFRHTRFPGVHNRPLCHPSGQNPLPLHLNLSQARDNRTQPRLRGRLLQLQAPEQFVEWQLNTDVEFAEVGVLGADRIEAHFVNDRLDLERIARKQSHAPFCVIEAG